MTLLLSRPNKTRNITSTAQKPDLVIVNRNSKEVKLVELTVSWDTSSNMVAALERKTERYENLATVIKGNGFRCSPTRVIL